MNTAQFAGSLLAGPGAELDEESDGSGCAFRIISVGLKPAGK